ncbi:MAG TPA: LysR substrate-binding domain-containing protein [Pseudolabrys sp.]|nr:LysR substrate-binding domain-containing protein [Pseudolabrys sp.]
MELRHLRYFIALAEELHFNRAAERLGMSQPPLSLQIKALEEELKVQLFERTNRRVNLTRAGAAFLDEARATLAQAERAASVAKRTQRGEIGEIRVGFTPSAPLVPPFMHTVLEFRRTFPDVRVVLDEHTTAEQISALMDGHHDIGFIRGPNRPDLHHTLDMIEFYNEPLAVILPAHHPLAGQRHDRPLAIQELRSEPFVLFPQRGGTSVYDQVVGLCRKAGFEPLVRQEARANFTILGLVAAGIGVSILPSCLEKVGVENLVFRTLGGAGAQTSIWLVHRKDNDAPAKQAFIAQATKNRVVPTKRTSRRKS